MEILDPGLNEGDRVRQAGSVDSHPCFVEHLRGRIAEYDLIPERCEPDGKAPGTSTSIEDAYPTRTELRDALQEVVENNGETQRAERGSIQFLIEARPHAVEVGVVPKFPAPAQAFPQALCHPRERHGAAEGSDAGRTHAGSPG